MNLSWVKKSRQRHRFIDILNSERIVPIGPVISDFLHVSVGLGVRWGMCPGLKANFNEL